MAYPFSRIEVSIPLASSDGKFYGRYPAGNAITPTTNYMGVNLNSVNYYDPEQKFLNIMLQGGSNFTGGQGFWFSGINGGNGETSEEPWLALDRYGYLTSMTATNGGVGNGLGTGGLQQYNCIYMLIKYNLGTPIGASMPYPTGSYTIQWNGGGTIALGNDVVSGSLAVTAGGASVTVSGTTITSTLSGTQTGSVSFNVGNPTSNGGIKLQINSVQVSPNHLQSIAIVETGRLASYNSGEIFHPTFLASLANVRRIRCMDLLDTNAQLHGFHFSAALTAGTTSATMTSTWGYPTGTYQAVLGNVTNSTADTVSLQNVTLTFGSATIGFVGGLTNALSHTQFADCGWVSRYNGWANRPIVGQVSYSGGVPYEICMALANKLTALYGYNVDCWLNVPIWANSFTGLGSAFWSGLATLVQANLGVNQKAYIELSNEVWNGQFSQFAYAALIGSNLFPAQLSTASAYAGQEWMGTQVAQMADQFFSTFEAASAGSYAQRVVVSMGTQNALSQGAAFLATSMNTPDWTSAAYTHHINGVHMAPYWAGWDSGNPSHGVAITFTAPPTGTSGTLTTALPSGTHLVQFTDASGNTQVRSVTLSASSVNITWTGALTGTPTTAATYGDIPVILAQPVPMDVLFGLMYSNTYGGITYPSVPTAGFIGGSVANLATLVNLIRGNGYSWSNITILGYEGGTTFEQDPTLITAEVAPWSALCDNAANDPRMEHCMYDPTHAFSANPGYLPAVSALMNGGLNYFSSCNGPDNGFQWGLIQSVMQPLNLTSGPPKWRAAQKFMTGAAA